MHQLRETRRNLRPALACPVLLLGAMAAPETHSEAWTIPLHVVIWTTLLVGLIMATAIILMR